MRILYIFIGFLSLRFILNLSKYLRTKRYHDLYIEWLSSDRGNKLLEVRAQVIGLLKDAGVTDSYVGFAQPVGFMQIQTGNASVFANFPNAREDIATHVNSMFLEAIGTYRARMFDTFNPLRWIEWLINLPRFTLQYLGVSADAVVIKLAQIVWWIAGAFVGFAYALYRPEFEALIKGWIGKLG